MDQYRLASSWNLCTKPSKYHYESKQCRNSCSGRLTHSHETLLRLFCAPYPATSHRWSHRTYLAPSPIHCFDIAKGHFFCNQWFGHLAPNCLDYSHWSPWCSCMMTLHSQCTCWMLRTCHTHCTWLLVLWNKVSMLVPTPPILETGTGLMHQ